MYRKRQPPQIFKKIINKCNEIKKKNAKRNKYTQNNAAPYRYVLKLQKENSTSNVEFIIIANYSDAM